MEENQMQAGANALLIFVGVIALLFFVGSIDNRADTSPTGSAPTRPTFTTVRQSSTSTAVVVPATTSQFRRSRVSVPTNLYRVTPTPTRSTRPPLYWMMPPAWNPMPQLPAAPSPEPWANPGPDLDCRDLNYRTVWVGNYDPHGLDADGDGWGCE